MRICMNFVGRRAGGLTVAGILALALWQAGTLGARGLSGQAASSQLNLEPVVEIRLHGSTPSLAWAADGRRLAINAAFGVYDNDRLAKRYSAELGVHVLDVQTGQSLYVPFAGARHPFWLDGDTIGWVNNYYTGDKAGLFLASAQPGAKVRKLGDASCAHRAYLGRNGSILAYIEGGSTYGWAFVDPRSGKARSAFPDDGRAGTEPPGSWDTPAALIVDQCPSRLGTVAAKASRAGGIELSLGGAAFRLAGERAYVFKHDYAPAGGAGPVQPCLSPDARHLAYLTPGGSSDEYVLKVVRVPSPIEARGLARPISSGSAQGPASLAVGARLQLHGSTPSLAWSPDGRRVVTNFAFEYYGHDSEIRRLGASLGIWVLDALSGRATHVFAGQGYHPFWLDSNTVGWGHSVYEDGAPGIYVAPAAAGAKAKRLGGLKGIHRTLLATDGRVLTYVGFPEYKRWGLVDLANGEFTALPALAETGSWDEPSGRFQDQCLQSTPGAHLVPDDRLGFALQVGAKSYALGDAPIMRYAGDGGSGPIRACLSPDGARVAFVAGGELRIAQVPY